MRRSTRGARGTCRPRAAEQLHVESAPPRTFRPSMSSSIRRIDATAVAALSLLGRGERHHAPVPRARHSSPWPSSLTLRRARTSTRPAATRAPCRSARSGRCPRASATPSDPPGAASARPGPARVPRLHRRQQRIEQVRAPAREVVHHRLGRLRPPLAHGVRHRQRRVLRAGSASSTTGSSSTGSSHAFVHRGRRGDVVRANAMMLHGTHVGLGDLLRPEQRAGAVHNLAQRPLASGA